MVSAVFAQELAGRVLAFDQDAAEHYAPIVTMRRVAGRPIEGLDALIAATAAAKGFAVATRDIGGFDGCGIGIIDRWAATAS